MPFTKASLKFLTDLTKNNNKEWFDQHRNQYLENLKEPALSFATEVISGAQKSGLPFVGDPKKCLFRQNRDIRFSHNKNPYKTNVGVCFTSIGEKNAFGLGYLHIEPKNCFYAVGFYMPEAPQVKKFRESISKNSVEFRKLLKLLTKHGWEWDESFSLKKIPSGYSEFANTDLEPFVKFKSFTVAKKLSLEDLCDIKLPQKASKEFKSALGLLEFGWKYVSPAKILK